MRITQRAVAQTALQGLNRNLAEVGRLNQQLTSGKLVSKPSDSPTGVNRAMQIRQDQAATVQYARNVSDAQGRLETTDSALGTVIEQVRRVQTLTLRAANEGAMSESSRTAIATEMRSIRESLIGVANTTIDGQPVFGGVTTGALAYDPDGTYAGLGGTGTVPVVPQMRRISADEEVRVDVTGPEAFGDPAGGDLFALVASIADDVVGDTDALPGHIASLDGAMDRLLTAISGVGARATRIETAAQVNTDRQLQLKGQLAGVEDIDLPKTIMELNMVQTSYQAALSATAKIIQPTLVDFLA
ncbi:flagellar hook-associated protein FlgL [Geodermatophilus sp. FMUSA9-8]|uniref:flagellar hook-associated protein FlgL n=1 Tax=Geodermatophilus sp. FMUSA9-8 TaxID=3120155 RepID=UPI003008A7B8